MKTSRIAIALATLATLSLVASPAFTQSKKAVKKSDAERKKIQRKDVTRAKVEAKESKPKKDMGLYYQSRFNMCLEKLKKSTNWDINVDGFCRVSFKSGGNNIYFDLRESNYRQSGSTFTISCADGSNCVQRSGVKASSGSLNFNQTDGVLDCLKEMGKICNKRKGN